LEDWGKKNKSRARVAMFFKGKYHIKKGRLKGRVEVPELQGGKN